MTTPTKVLDVGRADYRTVWNLQLALVEKNAAEGSNALILAEHPHVFTVGKGVTDPVPSEVRGVPVYRVERGGLWTYHGPEQLVGYPIISLEERGRDIRRFLRDLEHAIIGTVGKFGIVGERHEGHTGVWVGPTKLASIGVAVRNWITFHGFALNVNTDLSYFDMIEPCGLPSGTLTSMEQLVGHKIPVADVKREFLRSFSEVFDAELFVESEPLLRSA
jgi:lipoate-protein ligase B